MGRLMGEAIQCVNTPDIFPNRRIGFFTYAIVTVIIRRIMHIYQQTHRSGTLGSGQGQKE